MTIIETNKSLVVVKSATESQSFPKRDMFIRWFANQDEVVAYSVDEPNERKFAVNVRSKLTLTDKDGAGVNYTDMQDLAGKLADMLYIPLETVEV